MQRADCWILFFVQRLHWTVSVLRVFFFLCKYYFCVYQQIIRLNGNKYEKCRAKCTQPLACLWHLQFAICIGIRIGLISTLCLHIIIQSLCALLYIFFVSLFFSIIENNLKNAYKSVLNRRQWKSHSVHRIKLYCKMFCSIRFSYRCIL